MTANPWLRNGFIYLLILVAVGALFFQVFQPPQKTNLVSVSTVALDVQNGLVKKISSVGNTLTVTYKDIGKTATSAKANRDVSVEESLKNLGVSPDKILGVEIVYEQPPQW
ncbi:MAG: hypothetical protein HY257_10050, partial [Chloroflexi bacterium]|nr:hypothetical protein [Chloroflexota bacterium]